MTIQNLDRYGTSFVTSNKLGRTTEVLNEINEAFVAFAADASQPVLDIGCAYGVAARAALDAGATVIANDVDIDHLIGLVSRTPAERLGRLRLVQGHFPRELAFRPGSLSAIHASNVLNFLTGDEIDIGVQEMFDWLAPGGRVFIISATPYAQNIAGFISTYEERLRSGYKWPGLCERLQSYSDDPTMAELPDWLHLLDDTVLRRTFEASGFRVDEALMFERQGVPLYIKYDGRENVRLTATKPAAD